MKTENLAILFTDIVGFTAATSKQSRSENEELLAIHNRILFPVVRHYGGRIIKTIGDALLIVFKSPTDAMLCAMAMQDALFEYNRSTPENKRIHIRIAASLGEVRIVNKDIFGEPVNLTSRIEGITPPDEIYLSDAVYMAMNKAEVPCVEVGTKTLKGISEPVKIWQIPRFSRPRLVPEDVMNSEDISELAYPYGGAHLAAKKTEKKITFKEFALIAKPGMIWGTGIVIFLIICFSVIFFMDLSEKPLSRGEEVNTLSKNLNLTIDSGSKNINNQKAGISGLPEDSKTASVDSPAAPAGSGVNSKSMEHTPDSIAVSPEQPGPETQIPVIVETNSTENAGVEPEKEPVLLVSIPEPETDQVKERENISSPVTRLDPEIENLVQSLRSFDSAERRRAAKIIARSHGDNTVLLGEVEKALLKGYNEQIDDRHHVDAIAWMCKILGASGDEKYRKTLSTVAEDADNRKIQKYAQAALDDLQ